MNGEWQCLKCLMHLASETHNPMSTSTETTTEDQTQVSILSRPQGRIHQMVQVTRTEVELGDTWEKHSQLMSPVNRC